MAFCRTGKCYETQGLSPSLSLRTYRELKSSPSKMKATQDQTHVIIKIDSIGGTGMNSDSRIPHSIPPMYDISLAGPQGPQPPSSPRTNPETVTSTPRAMLAHTNRLIENLTEWSKNSERLPFKLSGRRSLARNAAAAAPLQRSISRFAWDPWTAPSLHVELRVAPQLVGCTHLRRPRNAHDDGGNTAAVVLDTRLCTRPSTPKPRSFQAKYCFETPGRQRLSELQMRPALERETSDLLQSSCSTCP
jgi:hypothetical protein